MFSNEKAVDYIRKGILEVVFFYFYGEFFINRYF